jgi:hypothetical protein
MQYKIIKLFKLDMDIIFLYSHICVDVTSSETDPGIQFEILDIETMNEYIPCKCPIAKAEKCRINH